MRAAAWASALLCEVPESGFRLRVGLLHAACFEEGTSRWILESDITFLKAIRQAGKLGKEFALLLIHQFKHGPFFITAQTMLSQCGVCYLISPIFLLSPSSVSGQSMKARSILLASLFILYHPICARSIGMVWCHFGFSLDRALAFFLFKTDRKGLCSSVHIFLLLFSFL